MNLIDILNFQPFGDHGVNSLLSIRVMHLVVAVPTVYLIKVTGKDMWKKLRNLKKILS